MIISYDVPIGADHEPRAGDIRGPDGLAGRRRIGGGFGCRDRLCGDLRKIARLVEAVSFDPGNAIGAAIRGDVEVRLNWSGAPPAVAAIRLAFWKVRATLGGMTNVTMLDVLAAPNSLACC